MTIVEMVDYFTGLMVLKFVFTKNKVKFLDNMFLAFFLSAIIDNLTATIVLITILPKLINDKNLKLW